MKLSSLLSSQLARNAIEATLVESANFLSFLFSYINCWCWIIFGENQPLSLTTFGNTNTFLCISFFLFQHCFELVRLTITCLSEMSDTKWTLSLIGSKFFYKRINIVQIYIKSLYDFSFRYFNSIHRRIHIVNTLLYIIRFDTSILPCGLPCKT